MKKAGKSLISLFLALLFLVGLTLVVWPIAKELSAYQADEDEYEAMAMEIVFYLLWFAIEGVA